MALLWADSAVVSWAAEAVSDAVLAVPCSESDDSPEEVAGCSELLLLPPVVVAVPCSPSVAVDVDEVSSSLLSLTNWYL